MTTAWIVYANTKDGWRGIKVFESPADADKWLCGYIKKTGTSVTDYTIKQKNI